MEIIGLNNFNILASNFNASTNRTSFDVMFPQIQVLSKYNVSGEFEVAGIPVKPSGNGLINIKIQDFRTIAEFSLVPNANNTNSVKMTDINVRFYLGNVINNNWNNEWDIATNNFINNFASQGLMLWSQEIQSRLDFIYNSMYMPLVNDMLQNVSMQQIIDALVEESAQFDSIDCPAN